MLTKYHKAVAGLLVFAAVTLGGCVRPGAVDMRVIGRYQQVMAERGPQQRGEDGLEPYLPGETTSPPLKIVREETSGRMRVLLSLTDVVIRALANNLDIRVIGFDPAISREEMIKAAAEFDYVVFAGFSYDVTDEQTTSTFLSGESSSRTWNVGIREKTVTGATWALEWKMARRFDPSGFSSLTRSYENTIALELSQPLLRDAWGEFNLAALRIARVDYKFTMARFRQEVENVVTEVISLYWSLIQARRDRMIQQQLLDRTRETYERTKKRMVLDATNVEVKQAEAAVETRTAGLIRTEKVINDVQDQLSRRIGDKQLNLLSDYEMVPTTAMNVEEVRLDQTDQLLTALQHSPVLEQARLAIARAQITVRVAENQTLPRLDVTFSTTMQGIGGGKHEAGEKMGTNDFRSYSLGVQFEYPLGNRERTADLRRRRAERLKAIADMQNRIDEVGVAIRERIRQVATTYREMKAQQRAVAAGVNELEALQASEELRRLTPEFLQVKLGAQERLAAAERAELRAMVEYNVALVELARVTGTVLKLHQVEIALPGVLGEGDFPTPRTDPPRARRSAEDARPVGER